MPRDEWVMCAEPASVPTLRARVVDFAARHGVEEPSLSALALGASEALTNSVQHAFPGREGMGELTACIEVDEDDEHVVLKISDDGLGMTLRPDTPGFGPGLSLIARTADEFTVRPGAGGVGTTIRMTFGVHPAGTEPTVAPVAPGGVPPRRHRRLTEGWLVIPLAAGVAAWVAVVYAVVHYLF